MRHLGPRCAWTIGGFALWALLAGPATAGEPAPLVSKGRVRALSFVPLPGLPSLVQRDHGGAAAAAAITAATSVLWVGAVRATAQHGAEEWALSIAGGYAASVVTSHLVGLRSRERAARRPQAAVVPLTLPSPDGRVTPGVWVSASL